MHRLNPRRRNHDWERNILSHHRCRQIALRGRPDDMGREPRFAECFDVAIDGQALFATRDQRAVDGLGQSLLRAFLRDGYRLEPLIACHG